MHFDPVMVYKLLLSHVEGVCAEALIKLLRKHSALPLIKILHDEVFPAKQKFDLVCAQARLGLVDPKEIVEAAIELCTACRKMMCQITGLDPEFLHCCLKFYIRNGDGEERVFNFARSRPLDGRCSEDLVFKPISGNTGWCAILGRSDGVRHWIPVNCFCSNDLPKYRSKYNTYRTRWEDYYSSNLVFPIRFERKVHLTTDHIGFLEFDSPRKNAFKRMPEIFEHPKTCEYQDKLSKALPYLAGSTIAQCLATLLRPYYEESVISLAGRSKEIDYSV